MAIQLTYVIIVNWNGRKVLQKCLASFFANTHSPNVRVLVIDNASTDDSVEMLRQNYPQVKVIINKSNLGFSKANNQGIKTALAAGARNLLLLNNDVEVRDRNWLESFFEVLNGEGKVGIVGCKLLFADGRIQHAGGCIRLRGAYHRGEREADKGQYNKVESMDYVTGAALLIRSEVVREIGFLDEGFTPLYCEDTDWCLRAHFAGYEVFYTPNPTLIHHCGSSAKKLGSTKNIFYFRRSSIRFFLLNYQPKDILERILRFEVPALFGCFIGRSHGSTLPIKLRSDAATRISLFVKEWVPSVMGLKDIIARRRQRFIFNLKLELNQRIC